MALIIEDGTGKSDAQSYAAAADLTAFAAARGITLTAATDAAKEILLIRAMDYLEAQEPQFQGTRFSETQALAFPREDIVLHGQEVAETPLPALLIKALCQLAVYADSGDLVASGDGREVIKKKVGPLETTYSESGGGANPQPALTAFWNFLNPLLSGGGGFSLTIEHA